MSARELAQKSPTCLGSSGGAARPPRGSPPEPACAVPPTGAPVASVDSAFNGLAVYRLDTIRLRAAACSYDGAATCEHVAFHLCLRAHGLRLGLAPYLVQSCGDGPPRQLVGPPRVQTRVLASGEVVHTVLAPER